jgi:hypothetical protein
VTIKDNVFVTPGEFGPVSIESKSINNVTWTNNVDGDGNPIVI